MTNTTRIYRVLLEYWHSKLQSSTFCQALSLANMSDMEVTQNCWRKWSQEAQQNTGHPQEPRCTSPLATAAWHATLITTCHWHLKIGTSVHTVVDSNQQSCLFWPLPPQNPISGSFLQRCNEALPVKLVLHSWKMDTQIKALVSAVKCRVWGTKAITLLPAAPFRIFLPYTQLKGTWVSWDCKTQKQAIVCPRSMAWTVLNAARTIQVAFVALHALREPVPNSVEGRVRFRLLP